MRIAIDIDDTLTESFDYFQPCVAEYFGVSPEQLRKEEISYSNLPQEWKDRELDFCRTYYDRLAAETPFKPDAAWGVAQLRQMGHNITILTARTTDFYTDPVATSARELANGGISYDSLVCTLDKGTACREMGIHLLIDDMPHNCDAAASQGCKTLLFTGQGNRQLQTNHPRVASWQEIVNAVQKMMEHNQ